MEQKVVLSSQIARVKNASNTPSDFTTVFDRSIVLGGNQGYVIVLDKVNTMTYSLLRNGLLQCFGTFKMPILMFISILVFRPEGQIGNPVRRDTRIYVRRILNASRISETQLNSCTISPS